MTKNKSIEHTHLSKFVGKWQTEGCILPTDTDPEIKFTGTDVYEWLPGEFFLLHKVDVMIGKDQTKPLK